MPRHGIGAMPHNESAEERREAARRRVERRHRERVSHAAGLVAEIAALRTSRYQTENHLSANEAERRIGLIEAELVSMGFTSDGADTLVGPAEARAAREAEEHARQRTMSEARGIHAELERHAAARNVALAAGDAKAAARATENVAHCEAELRRCLGLPADADLDAPGLIDPEPVPVKRRWRFRRREQRAVIEDPVRRALEDRREARGLPRDHEPGLYAVVPAGFEVVPDE
jgi:hypothetical protein